MTYHQQMIADYLQEIIQKNGLYLGEDLSIENIVVNKIRRLSLNEMLAIDINGNCVEAIIKLDGFDDSSSISKEAILIPYSKMEQYFYEQQQQIH